MNSVGKCSLCDYVGNNTHIHHIIPRSRGGSDDDSNLIELCTICHGKAHDVSFYDNKGLVSSKITQTKVIDKECLAYLNDVENNLHDFLMEYYYEHDSNVVTELLYQDAMSLQSLFIAMKYGKIKRNKYGDVVRNLHKIYKENNFGIDLSFLDKYEH